MPLPTANVHYYAKNMSDGVAEPSELHPRSIEITGSTIGQEGLTVAQNSRPRHSYDPGRRIRVA